LYDKFCKALSELQPRNIDIARTVAPKGNLKHEMSNIVKCLLKEAYVGHVDEVMYSSTKYKRNVSPVMTAEMEGTHFRSSPTSVAATFV
jgi:hypothetical protein